MTDTTLPAALAEIRDEFLELDEPIRLELLLEFANELPPVPERYEGHPELTERVVECQSPVYIVIDLDDDGLVQMHAAAHRIIGFRDLVAIRQGCQKCECIGMKRQ